MAKTSIRPEEQKIESSNLPALPTSPQLPAGYNPDRYDDETRDVQTPTLGLINKIGPLSKKFPKNAGDFAFGDVLLGPTATVIPIGFVKFFVESVRNGEPLKYGEIYDPPARKFVSANEAYRQGYAVEYDTNYPNRAEESARIAFLVAGPPDDDSGEFYLTAPDGRHWGVAVSSFRRGSLRGTFKPVFTHIYRLSQAQAKPIEEIAFYDWMWELRSEHVDNVQKKQDWFESRIKKLGHLPPDMIDWIRASVGAFSVSA